MSKMRTRTSTRCWFAECDDGLELEAAAVVLEDAEGKAAGSHCEWATEWKMPSGWKMLSQSQTTTLKKWARGSLLNWRSLSQIVRTSQKTMGRQGGCPTRQGSCERGRGERCWGEGRGGGLGRAARG